MKNDKMLVVSVLIVAFLALVCFALIDSVPPRALTDTTMWVLKRRVMRYAREHNGLPPNLFNLPQIDGFITETTDAWGRQINYIVKPGGIVTLSSQPPASAGPEIVRSFRTRNSSGEWAGEHEPWVDQQTK